MRDVSDPAVTATYFGTSSLYVTDGTVGIFIDAFLSRPPLLQVQFGRIRPNPARIDRALDDGNVGPVDAVFTAHSHFDHALDCVEVVTRKGGDLYGSPSTLNIGRGADLGEERMHLIQDGDEIAVGAFTVRVFEGMHSPGDRYPGVIDQPLRPPARARSYKTGDTFSFLLTHPTGAALVHPSANVVPGQFDGVRADVVYLGIGMLGAQDRTFQDDYWRHTVQTVQPKRVIPVHWDNFGRALTKKLRPMPRFLDDLSETRAFLATRPGIPIVWQQAFETIALFDH